MRQLTIVMYHYVRDLERSRYPRIKARRTADFRAQLDYLADHYTVVAARDVIAASRGEAELPPNAAWLTFDDGYLDHFTTVFPLLDERGWQGSFFAPAMTTLQGKLLDVNKIHLILASVEEPQRIVAEIGSFLEANADSTPQFASLWNEHAKPSPLDPAEVMFVKRVLQRGLPPAVRGRLVDALFKKFVSIDERTIAAETYMSLDQIKLMLRSGMYFGSHGSDHLWMDSLSPQEQANEIRLSLDFLGKIGAPTADWIMCYPYGASNASLLDILERSKCALGITVRRGIADFTKDRPLELPRLDTNDLPVTVGRMQAAG